MAVAVWELRLYPRGGHRAGFVSSGFWRGGTAFLGTASKVCPAFNASPERATCKGHTRIPCASFTSLFPGEGRRFESRYPSCPLPFAGSFLKTRRFAVFPSAFWMLSDTRMPCWRGHTLPVVPRDDPYPSLLFPGTLPPQLMGDKCHPCPPWALRAG